MISQFIIEFRTHKGFTLSVCYSDKQIVRCLKQGPLDLIQRNFLCPVTGITYAIIAILHDYIIKIVHPGPTRKVAQFNSDFMDHMHNWRVYFRVPVIPLEKLKNQEGSL